MPIHNSTDDPYSTVQALLEYREVKPNTADEQTWAKIAADYGLNNDQYLDGWRTILEGGTAS